MADWYGLVENYAVDVNQIDSYDYSALILASLCGHLDIVEYLLENGAVLERDTFVGERCLYGALNDEIRNTLLRYGRCSLDNLC
jgi:ankyrin repeat and BTB/POZ domain-containing protein 1